MARRVAPTVFLAGVSPITVALVAGVAALVAMTTGSVVRAVVAGIAAWVVRVFIATRVAKRIETLPRRIDPFALREPWRFFVRDAISARNRFADALDGADAGPLRERLVEIGDALNHGVEQCWQAAQKGQQLDARHIPVNSGVIEAMEPDDPRRRGMEAQLESHAQLAEARNAPGSNSNDSTYGSTSRWCGGELRTRPEARRTSMRSRPRSPTW